LAGEEILTSSEAAEMLGVHVNTIRRWTNSGLLKGFRIGTRGDRRYRREDVENLKTDGKSSLTR
jgi:excisionase family DNA binding protein